MEDMERPGKGRPKYTNHKENESMKRTGVFGKTIVLGIIAACAALALTTQALAQKAQELKDAHKMMSDGWKMYNDGQRSSRARR